MDHPEGELALAPLGAGDLIDRAVRLYRRHFLTLIRIAAPPVLISAVGSTITTIAFREFTATASGLRLGIFILVWLAGLVIIGCGSLFSIIVMGGATYNLAAHLLWNEPVSMRATYRAVKSRFWGLLAGSFLVASWLAVAAGAAFMVFYFGMLIIMLIAVGFGRAMTGWLAVVIGVVGTIIAGVAGSFIFFLLAARVAYVPQAILVEGRGVFSAIGRSFSLASGNVKRLMAMTLFTFFATYSALMLLIIPLGWYGYLNGVDLSIFSKAEWPVWYAIGYEVIWQCSHILLAPIWMLGLSLLYVDERVRHEGYDIELMAARRLPEMPKLPGVMSPFAPALVSDSSQRIVPMPGAMPASPVLGLNQTS